VAGSESGGVMTTTPNYSWPLIENTDFVTNLPADLETLADAIDDTVKDLNPGTTAGDVDYYTSGTAKARLGIGTAGQVLAVNSGATAPEWINVAGGGQTLIESGSLTGASVTTGTIPSGYNDLILIVRSFLPATDGSRIALRLNGSSSSVYGVMKSNSTGENVTNATLMDFAGLQADNGVGSTNSLIAFTFPDYLNTATWRLVHCIGVAHNATTATNFNFGLQMGAARITAAITSITILSNSGNIDGDYLLYGEK
jgi:hypothetical protein